MFKSYLLECFLRANSVLKHLVTLDRTAFLRPLLSAWFRVTIVRNIFMFRNYLNLIRPGDQDGYYPWGDRPSSICRSSRKSSNCQTAWHRLEIKMNRTVDINRRTERNLFFIVTEHNRKPRYFTLPIKLPTQIYNK